MLMFRFHPGYLLKAAFPLYKSGSLQVTIKKLRYDLHDNRKK